MISFKAFSLVFLAVIGLVVTAPHDDDDHSKHCHIDGFPTIHVNIGETIQLPGACLKLICQESDQFEVVGSCNQKPNSPENVDFAKKLVAGEKCHA
nr:uncharacterized protein LOC111422637 isoform X2 [Onthophagus taurus]